MLDLLEKILYGSWIGSENIFFAKVVCDLNTVQHFCHARMFLLYTENCTH